MICLKVKRAIEDKTLKMSKNERLISLYIQPNARHDKVVGLFNGEIKIQIIAPAVDNKANLYLQKWLAKEFGVPKSAVMLKKGEHSRHKTFCIINPKLTPSWLERAN